MLYILTGLVINLCFPNLDWTTEVVAVKQSKHIYYNFCAMAIVAVQLELLHYLTILYGPTWYFPTIASC